MILELSIEQTEDLRELVSNTVADLSYEIAATDRPSYRVKLMQRRERFREMLRLIDHASRPASSFSQETPAVLKELAHPGG